VGVLIGCPASPIFCGSQGASQAESGGAFQSGVATSRLIRGKRRYVLIVASSVIVALSSFEIGQPAFASSAAFWTLALSAPGTLTAVLR
jgi:hypothetical protein